MNKTCGSGPSWPRAITVSLTRMLQGMSLNVFSLRMCHIHQCTQRFTVGCPPRVLSDQAEHHGGSILFDAFSALLGGSTRWRQSAHAAAVQHHVESLIVPSYSGLTPLGSAEVQELCFWYSARSGLVSCVLCHYRLQAGHILYKKPRGQSLHTSLLHALHKAVVPNASLKVQCQYQC